MNRDERLLEFRNLLYPNNEEAEELNETQVKKVIYEGLREFLKDKQYQFIVGSYQFDITPKNLSVVYETPDTRIEVSNKDVHFETTRQVPVRFFVISELDMPEYPGDTPAIMVTGDIFRYDNAILDETYELTLLTKDENDVIKNYLKVPEDATAFEDEFINDPKTITINRHIKKTDKRTDVGVFFNSFKIRSVEFDYQNNVYHRTHFESDKDYSELVPELDKRKRTISTIYSTIIEFYNEYMKN